MEAKRNTSKRYPHEVKERAVRLVLEARAEDPKDTVVIGRIGRQLGVGPESLRQWVKQAESVNNLYKTELIRGPDQGPWRTVEDVELPTLSWVHWYNTERLHEYLGYVPPAEFEAAYAAGKTDQDLVGIQ